MFNQRLCDNCGKRPAVYYMMNVINGVATERYLCDECKQKLGFVKKQPNLDFGGFFSAIGSPFGAYDAKEKHRVCPTCGYGSGEYRKTGFLGCPDCYEAFADMINPALVRMQKDTKHVGKSPNEFYSPEEAKYNELLRQRDEAVEKEDFALAAKLTEEMKQMKGGEQK